MSQKEIYAYCCPNHEISYQAVYKAIHELLAEGVIEKTSSGSFRLSVEFGRKIVHYWNGVLSAYENDHPKQRVFVGRALVPSAHKYVFGESDLTIENVPSVIFSKSTFHELMSMTSDDQLKGLADLIAEKNFNFIRDHMLEPNAPMDPARYLEKLNEQATSFYWGSIRFNVKNDQIALKIHSSSFTTEKEKKFYDSIYVRFMKLLGYKLKHQDELSKSYYFERDAS